MYHIYKLYTILCTCQIHVLFVITLVIYVITWENNESQLHSRQTWIKIFFPFPQLLYSINLSHRHKNITWIFKKIPDLSQNFLISYRISWADDTDDSESLLLPCIFLAHTKGAGSTFLRHAHSIPLLPLCLQLWVASSWKKPTHISFIPSSENS